MPQHVRRAEQLPSCDIVIPGSRLGSTAADMKIPALSPLSIFGFGQESTPAASEPDLAARTSQCQGWGQTRGEALQGSASVLSATDSESHSQDMEPLSPVTREYRRRPRTLSSELTEPKVRTLRSREDVKVQQQMTQLPFVMWNVMHAHRASCAGAKIL